MRLDLPELATIRPIPAVLTVAACILVFTLRWPMLRVLATCAGRGALALPWQGFPSTESSAGLRGLGDPLQPQQICTILRGDERWRSVRPPTPPARARPADPATRPAGPSSRRKDR